MYGYNILCLFYSRVASLTWLWSNTGSFYLWVISPLGFFFTNKEEGNSNKLVNRKHAEVDNKYYIFNQLDQKAH